jgi:hypothetical protein
MLGISEGSEDCGFLYFPRSYDLKCVSKTEPSIRNGVLDSVHGIPLVGEFGFI